MNRRQLRKLGKEALELIEEAVHLLRLAPARVLATYYLGTLPFVLALLYFWTDMSRGAFAWRHCPEAALGVALFYVWMKCWQAAFARQLHDRLSGHPASRWSFGRVVRLVAAQMFVQPTQFALLPVALVATVPFGWLYAFYHNFSLFGDGESPTTRAAMRRAWRQALLWFGQNHVLLSVFWLFGTLVFFNVAVVIMVLPALLKMLFGFETNYTMSMQSFFNTTFLAVAGSVTYLCINPLIKAGYVLRCFYGESLQTGADLKAELKPLLPAVALVVVLFFAFPASSHAETNPPPATFSTQLDRSIEEVLNRPDYAWRFPREHAPATTEQRSLIGKFIDATIKLLRKWAHAIKKWMDKTSDWIEELLRKLFRRERTTTSGDWTGTIHGLLFVLLAAAVCCLALLLIRGWRQRRRREIAAEPVVPAIDVADENVIASQLPSTDWLAKARELIAAGELRLALRAFYLASLAELAERELIVIEKFKSNGDYERELRRRARSRPESLRAFDENVATFEGAWYGVHDVSREVLDRFTANLDRIREAA